MLNKNELFCHKYKPVYFKDYKINLDFINKLEIFLKLNQLNIIIHGDTSTGKTTILNTIINEYYKENTKQDQLNNILYINNLKEQGINFFRNDVKYFCETKSTIKNKKKMIVIDDIDYINEQSQQVFRNFIDKFSDKIFFILSCTNIQKVIENIQSRLDIIKINKFKREELNDFMEYIISNENIIIDDETKYFIGELCDGSIQLLLHYMEIFYILNEPIKYDVAQSLCTNISFNILDNYINIIRKKDLKEAVLFINNIYEEGYSVIDILDVLFFYVKITDKLIEKEKYDVVKLICKYISIFYNQHEHEIELYFFTNNLQQVLS